ncbi:GGDEF domain-containing protein [Sphingomonas bacterium]|uniref:GGDEF domain-containing protein n=1 Tax=Sphingomonas bacterium TaxID=1895847 RepID=UPI001576DBA9|nr:GGDEF domain-containing protein [Sphingomonas bacterium]
MISGGHPGLALIAITFMVALVLAIAWLDFDRPRHALSWSVAFGLLGLVWVLDGLFSQLHQQSPVLRFALLALCGIATGLNTIGFRQRAGKPAPRRPVATAIATQIAATAIILGAGGSRNVAAWPLYILSAAAAWNASRSLIGRRQGERAAERLAQYGLWTLTLLSLALLLSGALAEFGWYQGLCHLSAADFVPFFPVSITGIGLFTVFLLTADLADQSRRLAGTDVLTGLLNRRGFDDAASALLGSAARNGRNISLAMIDIDRFKEVNDRFGHLAGDGVLRHFATCLVEHARPRDILARVGGEEFALVFADLDVGAASRIAETIRAMVADCPLGLPEDYRITASFGIAELGVDDNLAALLSHADRALYEAKSRGRNRVVAP